MRMRFWRSREYRIWGGPRTLTAGMMVGPELRCQALSGFPATYVLAGLAGLAGSGRLWPPLVFSWFFLGFSCFFLVPFWFFWFFRFFPFFSVFRLCHHMFLLHERFFQHVNILRGFWPARGHFGHPHMDFWSPGELQTSKFLSQPLAGLGDDSW